MRPSLVGGWLLSLAVAGVGGYGLARSADAEPAPAGPTVQEQLELQHALLVSLRAQVSALDLKLADLSRSRAPVVVAAPSALAATALASGAPAAPDAPREVAREDAEELLARGEEVVVSALGTGRWRTEDVLALRAVLPGMPKAQREALLRRLITARNEGRLTPDEGGPLF
ncbi:hypothetical protein [Pyxidicoccus xibeiensis]|uniref:hypothetical protein n=1 Tax=Pyxidicoccus xibeiensis TaxID=2906759 RepID=UPI0020A715BF|nr:hypothetical protein [Pyxidicoccus xibeiensis]MCP3143011.1 hypothetical protein [Pyxidicoccus xibeiensis]